MGDPPPENQPRVISGLGPEESPESAGSHLPVLELDQGVYDRALDCVHCGLCLPACPTYTENGLEADSPRGRIVLMKGLADGTVDPSDTVIGHLDQCLDCRACETACPSGVVYHELIEQTRQRLAERDLENSDGWSDRLVQAAFYHLLTYPRRLKAALLPARVLQKLGLWRRLSESRLARRLPSQLAKMQQMLPEDGPLWPARLAGFHPAHRPSPLAHRQSPPARVSFLSGCIGGVLFPDLNRRTVELLQYAGCDVFVPRAQQCCGAIHQHGGRVETAQRMAAVNLDALLTPDGEEVDYIVNNAAGCGAMLKEYDHLLGDDPANQERAQRFAAKTRDVSELLAERLPDRPGQPVRKVAAYHDACHLIHAQGVAEPPRRLLERIEGLTLVPLSESDMCCGAAGTYNLSQPVMASRLGERKMRHIQATGAEVCITGNVGCAMQIQSHARRLGIDLEVAHPVDLLHEAYGAGGRST